MGTNVWCFAWLKIKIVGLLSLKLHIVCSALPLLPNREMFWELELQLWESSSIV
jgi:hypothetical protein